MGETKKEIMYKGPGLCTLLGVAFIILKLCNVITWSWWWVTAPLWGPLAILLAILIIMGLVLGVVTIWSIFNT